MIFSLAVESRANWKAIVSTRRARAALEVRNILSSTLQTFPQCQTKVPPPDVPSSSRGKTALLDELAAYGEEIGT